MSGLREYAAPTLPLELMAQVLLHIEQQQRIQSCSMVSHAWREAVTRIPIHVRYSFSRAREYHMLNRWLKYNGSVNRIQSLEVDSKLPCWPRPVFSTLPALQLPVQRLGTLQSLQLKLCQLQPIQTAGAAQSICRHTADHGTAAAAAAADWSALSKLTELRLKGCVVDLGGLSSCTALQHLFLDLPSSPNEAATATDGAPTADEIALTATLSDLQHLTFLWLNKYMQAGANPVKFETISPALSNLQQLKVLGLGHFVNITELSLANLPHSLIALNLQSQRMGAALSPDTTPQLQQLTNLQELHLHWSSALDPKLLLSYPQLTLLDLHHIKHEEEHEVRHLLAVLGQLQQLQHLSVRDSIGCFLLDMTPFTALTASSNLTYLDVLGCDLEVGVADVLFRPEQPCRGLVELIAGSEVFNIADSFQLLVECCPALQHLAVVYRYEEGIGDIDDEGVGELQALPGLTHLSFHGVHFSDEGLRSISECQQLQELGLVVAGVSTAGLTHLTRLTALTSLLYHCFADGQPIQLKLENQAAAGCPPDVHQQLEEYTRQQEKVHKSEREAAAGLDGEAEMAGTDLVDFGP